MSPNTTRSSSSSGRKDSWRTRSITSRPWVNTRSPSGVSSANRTSDAVHPADQSSCLERPASVPNAWSVWKVSSARSCSDEPGCA